MAMQTAVSYTPYATYSRGVTGDIITFPHFEEGGLLYETQNLLSENYNGTESSDKYGDNLTLSQLTGKEEIDVMSSFDESDAEPMSMEMLEYICDSSNSHPSINRRDACYNIHDRIKGGQLKRKGLLLSTQNMGKVLHKVFKAVVNDISQALPILVESGSDFS